MIKINIQGTYRAKVAFNLLGRRLTLWSKAGAFDETIDLGQGIHSSRRHDFGPFEAFVTLDETALSVGITVGDGLIEVWSHKWPISEFVGHRRASLNINAKGLEVKATVTLSQADREAA